VRQLGLHIYPGGLVLIQAAGELIQLPFKDRTGWPLSKAIEADPLKESPPHPDIPLGLDYSISNMVFGGGQPLHLVI
jgi:hypothetical protein